MAGSTEQLQEREAFEARREDVSHDEQRRLLRGLVSLVLLVILVGALVLAVPGLRHVADRLGEVNPWWIALAIVLEIGSCIGYVLAFQMVFYRVPWLPAMRVALSEMAFGAVVPAGGAGGIAIGAWWAKAKGGSLGRFMHRSAVLFLITSGVNAATLALAGILAGLHVLPVPHPFLLGTVPGLVGVAGIVLFWNIPRLARRASAGTGRTRLQRWLAVTAAVVEDAKAEVLRGDWRLLGAVAYLWCDIAVMWVCFHAFGASPSIGVVTLGFIIGYLGNIVPVPGGIGALDGGLTGAMVLYGMDPASAAAGVLLYHAIVLWIPTLLGTIAFMRLRGSLDEPVVLHPERAAAKV